MSTKKKILILLSRSEKSDRSRLSGILRFAEQRNDWHIRFININSPNFNTECRVALEDWRPDALMTAHLNAVTKLITARGICLPPIRTAMDYTSPDIRNDVEVFADDHAIGKAAAELLIRRNYRSLAYFDAGESPEGTHSRMRLDGFRHRATKDHLKVASLVIRPGQIGRHEMLVDFLKNLDKPCGVFCFADEYALDLIVTCKEARISLPGELALVGVDNDIDLCDSLCPTLSSIEPDFARSGYIAAEFTNRALANGGYRRTKRVSYGVLRVVERASTQDLRGVGRIASLANEIIRNEVFSGLTVGDLAKQLNISRTLLQNYYRTVHGITVRERLREMRLERIKELLETTPKPIADIAAEAGFRTLVAAQVAFRSLTGQTMREWRNAKYERGNPRA